MTFSIRIPVPFTSAYLYASCHRWHDVLPQGAPWFDAWSYRDQVDGARILEMRFGCHDVMLAAKGPGRSRSRNASA